jgi:hypothetical protein
MAIGADNFTELLSTTVQKLEGTLVDQVFTSHPTLDALRSVVTSGDGPSIIVPVRGALLGRTSQSDELGTFSTDVDGPIAGVAKYDYSNPIVTPTSVAFKTIALNQGANKVIDLVKAHIEAAKDDHATHLASELYSTSGAFNSLPQIVGNAATDNGDRLGGIDSSVNSWWSSTVRESDAGDEDIRLAFRRVANGVLDASGKKATIIMSGSDVFDEYEASLDDQIRYNALSTGDSRFRELRFDGVTIRRDGQDCPSQECYFLYTPALVVKNLAGYFMKVEAAQRVQGTLTDVIPMATMLAVGTTERRTHGRLIRTV